MIKEDTMRNNDLGIFDIKNNTIRFIKKNKWLFVSALIVFLLLVSLNAFIETDYAIRLSMINKKVPEYRLGKFYYNDLTYREQILYNNVSKAVETCAEYTEILPYHYTAAEFKGVMKYLLADNPEYFYINDSSAELLSNRHKTRIKLNYIHMPEEIEFMKTELNMVLNAAQLAVSEITDEFSREVALHDYLIRNCVFNKADSDDNDIYNTAYGALVLGKAYSNGYALALKLLFDKGEIFNFVVYGTVDYKPHMWNMVYIDQKFYHVDASWNDADLDFEPNLMFHGYFNLSDKLMLLDHKPDNRSILPTADDNKTYYHIREIYVDSVVSLECIMNRELLKAGYANRNYLELYLDLSVDPDEYYNIIIDTINRVNDLQDDFRFLPVYREYNASFTNKAVTLRLFYE